MGLDEISGRWKVQVAGEDKTILIRSGHLMATIKGLTSERGKELNGKKATLAAMCNDGKKMAVWVEGEKKEILIGRRNVERETQHVMIDDDSDDENLWAVGQMVTLECYDESVYVEEQKLYVELRVLKT